MTDELKFKALIPVTSLVLRDHCWANDGEYTWVGPVLMSIYIGYTEVNWNGTRAEPIMLSILKIFGT